MKKCKWLVVLAMVLVLGMLSACGDDNGANGDDSSDDDWPVIIIDGVGLAGSYTITVGESDFPTHIPLVMVAEALNSTVHWNTDTNAVALTGRNGNITFTAGNANYMVQNEAFDWLAPSVVQNGNLYVPIPFFRVVFGMGQSAWFGGHVTISTEGDDMM